MQTAHESPRAEVRKNPRGKPNNIADTFTSENLLYLKVIYRHAIKYAPRNPRFIRLRITSIYLRIAYFPSRGTLRERSPILSKLSAEKNEIR